MTNKVIHFFKYLEYDDLYNLGFKFDLPVKSSLNTYVAKLKTPIYFILPKNEILDLKQDNAGNNIFQYIVDVDEHSSFLTFLDNLDSLCINIASENSQIWFKKHMDSRTLVDLYNNLYYETEDDENENETLTVCDFHITTTELLDELSDYNDNNDTNLKVYIEGIEFFKKTFKWKLVLDSLVDNVEEDEEEDEDDSHKVSDDFDFDSLINNADTKSQRDVITNKIVNQTAGNQNNSKSSDTESQAPKQQSQKPSDTVSQAPSKQLDTMSQMSRQSTQQSSSRPADSVSQAPSKSFDTISRQSTQQSSTSRPVDTVSRQPTQQSSRPADTVSQVSRQPASSRPADTVSQVSRQQSQPSSSRPNDLVSQAPRQQSQRPSDTMSQMSSRLPSMPQPISVGRQQSDTMSRQSNMPVSRVQPTTSRNIETQSINQERNRNSDLQSRLNNIENVGNNLGRDVIDELADFDTKSNVRKEIIENVQAKREILQDLESKISQKKIEIESYQSNADRARKAAEALSKKAIDSQNELKKYQEKFNELSQTTSVLSKSK